MTPADKKLRAHFGSWERGKQALKRADRERVDLELSSSVEMDDWGKPQWPSDHRWDYAVVRNGRVLALEVHPATAGDVGDVIDKKAWGAARLTDASVTAAQWWWIPSGKNTVPSTGSASRRLAKAGIRLSRRVLDAKQVEGPR